MNKLTQKKTNQDIPLEFIPLKSSLPDTRKPTKTKQILASNACSTTIKQA
jgi:hypothetical protein